MASLRARLIAVLLVVSAAGLVVLAGITYAEQSSFGLERADRQLQAALPALEHQLDENAGRNTYAGAGQAPGGGFDRDHDGDRGLPPGEVNLPPGTYGIRRDARGAAAGDPVVITYGQDPPAPPDLPRVLPATAFTVAASGDSELRYRVRAVPSRDGAGTIVAAIPLAEADATLSRLLRVEAIVICAVLIVLGLVGALLVRLGLRPLDRIGTTAGMIAGGDLSRRVSPATPRTEVGRLGMALNAMLDRLEDAFAKRRKSEEQLRRFLSDASHELRTPLASIRGYAELFRMGAAREPEDVGKAMRRIEEEAARMGVLVEDLLTLARLDELRDPVRERVDVGELAEDAVDDARAAAPDRAFTVSAADDADVLADPDQLRQVLGNLLRNAIVHTGAGTPVEVDVERADGSVRIAVRDHGPGLPPGGGDALFERFWRAEAGRERGRDGAGLGLAIVAGIVDAHHGRVAATDAPGGGACFEVLLPAAGTNSSE